jgi:succinate dehydrogenase/fumarate reductase flavoprotein subunit
MTTSPAPLPPSNDEATDVLVIGSGTGLAAALSAREQGLSVTVVEKTAFVGGSTARSGGAFWIPANGILEDAGAHDSPERALRYLRAVVRDTSPDEKLRGYVAHGPETVSMLSRTTRLRFSWARGYSDYHPELPGGSAMGRSCESRPFDTALLGAHRSSLRSGVMELPIPMPVTGADYKWLNLAVKVPLRGMVVALRRAAQGIGGLLLGRRYAAGGVALAAGLYDGALRAGVRIHRETAMTGLVEEDGRVVGATVVHQGRERTIRARRGVVISAGGFDHDLARRRSDQLEALEDWSLGAEGNTGDGIAAAERIGTAVASLDQAWWFPAIAPVGGGAPTVMLAERSLPGSFMVDGSGRRFLNEATDYMSFGQRVQERERAGDPVGQMWLVFDRTYRRSYLLGGALLPGMPLPHAWYESGVAVRGGSWRELALRMGVPADDFERTARGFVDAAARGVDEDFHRGDSAYDRYYGDPTVTPNPTLRALDDRHLFAVKVVLSDLGTCGGIATDARARALRPDGTPVAGLYAIGNSAGNAFGDRYPGAGATIGQGLVFGHVAALECAGIDTSVS